MKPITLGLSLCISALERNKLLQIFSLVLLIVATWIGTIVDSLYL